MEIFTQKYYSATSSTENYEPGTGTLYCGSVKNTAVKVGFLWLGTVGETSEVSFNDRSWFFSAPVRLLKANSVNVSTWKTAILFVSMPLIFLKAMLFGDSIYKIETINKDFGGKSVEDVSEAFELAKKMRI